MKIDNIKLAKIEKLLEYIFLSGEDYFTITKLQVKSDIGNNEIRTLINVLCKFNILYSVSKVGIFVNKKLLSGLLLDKLIFNQTIKYYEFNNKKCNFKIHKTSDMERNNLFRSNSNDDFSKNLVNFFLITMWIHINYNLLYEINYSVEDDKLLIRKRGFVESNNKVILETRILTSNYVSYY